MPVKRRHKTTSTKSIPREQKYVEKQRKRITTSLEKDYVDIEELQKIAFENQGFLTNTLRKKVWPKLLHVDIYREPSYKTYMQPHPSDDQIERDIDRSLWNYDCVQHIKYSDRRKKRKCLSGMINAILNKNSQLPLHYYQGFHDVCTVFLLVHGEFTACSVIDRVSISYFREPMKKDFQPMMEVVKMLFPIIKHHDPLLYEFLKCSEVAPYVALPWMITWFSHHIRDFEKVTRLYDVFLSSHPLFSLYVSAALIIQNRKLILESPCEFGSIHGLLASLPEQSLDVERVIASARNLFDVLPPKKLINRAFEAKVPKKSPMLQYPYQFQKNKYQLPDRVLYELFKTNKPYPPPPPPESSTWNLVVVLASWVSFFVSLGCTLYMVIAVLRQLRIL